MNGTELENYYREHLEEDIIFCLSERRDMPYDAAMRMFYMSKLSEDIYVGRYGIQYLDYTLLTDLLEAEISRDCKSAIIG